MSNVIELREQGSQPVLYVRVRTSVEDLPNIIGMNFMKIAGYITSLGEEPAGPPYTAYHNTDMEDLDVEMGFPVVNELPGCDPILAGTMWEGPVASYMHKGSYESLEQVYARIYEWIAENGYEPVGSYFEYYFNSPMEAPEEELLTRIDIPVKRSSGI